MTADEKVTLTAGGKGKTGCMGNIAAIPRVGFPGFCLSDASNGLVRTSSADPARIESTLMLINT